MSNVALPAAPLSEVRDVVETFRRLRVVPADWVDVLTSAATTLDSMPRDQISLFHLDDILLEIRSLVSQGFGGNDELVARIADSAHELLRNSIPAGIPTRDDDDWTFPRLTGA